MPKKKTLNEFIEQIKLLHGDKYDYRLVDYTGKDNKVKIICSEHGIFEQSPHNHLKGHNCPSCAGRGKLNKDNVIKVFITKHNNKYDYSLTVYINEKTKIKIICPYHSVFEQTPNHHKQGDGCPKCGGSEKLTTEKFIERSKKIHYNKYDYSLVEYINSKSKVKLICPKHGVFKQSSDVHIINKSGCPICNESKGEKEIRLLLEDNNINFIQQKKFSDCKYKRRLPFDFYLTDYNTCIEFNGKQHYEPIKHFGGGDVFNEQQKKDKIKKEYCYDNNIPLIIIKYNENVLDKLEYLI